MSGFNVLIPGLKMAIFKFNIARAIQSV
jgi:hypothetical protein